MVVQYRAELWWRGQKGWYEDYQKLVHRERKTITGKLTSTPTGEAVQEARLENTMFLLNNRHRRYGLGHLTEPRIQQMRNFLSVILREPKKHTQPGKHMKDNGTSICANEPRREHLGW